jgi:hypothetical protein
MIRAAKADVHLFEEVERDETATQQAAIVVGIAAISSAIGAAVYAILTRGQVPAGTVAGGPVGMFIITLVGFFLGWIIWSYVAYFVGTRMFGGTATPGELLRCVGFAQVPGIAGILRLIPVIGPIITFVVWIWSIYVGFVAVRQALDLDNTKAILTIIIGGIAAFIIQAIIAVILSPLVLMGI